MAGEIVRRRRRILACVLHPILVAPHEASEIERHPRGACDGGENALRNRNRHAPHRAVGVASYRRGERPRGIVEALLLVPDLGRPRRDRPPLGIEDALLDPILYCGLHPRVKVEQQIDVSGALDRRDVAVAPEHVADLDRCRAVAKSGFREAVEHVGCIALALDCLEKPPIHRLIHAAVCLKPSAGSCRNRLRKRASLVPDLAAQFTGVGCHRVGVSRSGERADRERRRGAGLDRTAVHVRIRTIAAKQNLKHRAGVAADRARSVSCEIRHAQVVDSVSERQDHDTRP